MIVATVAIHGAATIAITAPTTTIRDERAARPSV
jgi:hypothetical protein